jgi:hypothetical protein
MGGLANAALTVVTMPRSGGKQIAAHGGRLIGEPRATPGEDEP